MAKLTEKAKKTIPDSQFGEPGARKYPMPDASHAANAKARATQQLKKGNLSGAQKSKIDAKANKVLGKKKQPNVAKVAQNIKKKLSDRGKNRSEIGFES